MIKTHRSPYLPPELHALVGNLGPGERTPLFRMASGWQRYSWYLRLPCRPGHPGRVWSGWSARLDLRRGGGDGQAQPGDACRYASVEHKDSRAPQNLYPIGGLERYLRRRLGDNGLLERTLRSAAG